MRKLLKTYLPFARASVQEFLAYPIETLLYTFGMTIGMFVIYYIWKVIYSTGQNAVLEGFTFREMIGYIVLSFCTMQVMDNGTVWMIASDIREGSIIMNLIKPINYHLRIFSTVFGMVMFILLVIVLPVLLILSLLMKIGYVYLIPMFFVSVILGVILSFLFDFLFGMLAFYIKNLWGIGFGKYALVRLLSGALIPLAFFPDFFQRILEYLPFKGMIYTPIMIYLGKFSGETLLMAFINQILWIIVLGFFNFVLWKKAVSRLTVQGG